MIRCDHCGAETSNGLNLCEACRLAAATYLEFLPVYYRNLARWRPTRSTSRSVPGSRIPEGVIPAAGDRIARNLDEATLVLTGWARKLAKARPHHARTIARILALDELAGIHLLCRLFDRHLTSLATLEQLDEKTGRPAPVVGAFVRDLRHHADKLRTLTEALVPGWYAGACGTCSTPTYVVPGLTWVTCAGCGTTTHAAAHLDTIVDEALDWIAPPMRLAEAIVVLVDAEHSVPRLHKRISKWGERHEIQATRRTSSEGTPVGPKCYRLGDVLDRLHGEGPSLDLEQLYRARVARITGLGRTA